MKSTDVFTNSSNSLKMNSFEMNLSRKNSTKLNLLKTRSRTNLESSLFKRKIISIISQKIITTLKTSNSVRSTNSNVEMINISISMRRKMFQSSSISMHFKSTLDQTCKHQSNKIVMNSIKKLKLDVNLKSSIVRLIERNQLLTQLKLAKSALFKTTEISNNVRILNVVDQVKELIVSSHDDIKNFSIKILHQKVDKMMKKIDNDKSSIIKLINLNFNFNFNSDQASKSNLNSEVAKLT